MTKKEMQVTLQNISYGNKGVMYNDAWHTVVGKAADYVDKLSKGTAVITEDENGNVVFIRQNKEAKPNDEPTPAGTEEKVEEAKPGDFYKAKEDRIMRMNALSTATQLMKLVDEHNSKIIQDKPEKLCTKDVATAAMFLAGQLKSWITTGTDPFTK